MKNKTIVRISTLVFVVVLLVGCAIPAFASQTTTGGIWHPEFYWQGYVSKPVGAGTGVLFSGPIGEGVVFGVENVNSSNAPMELGDHTYQVNGLTGYGVSIEPYADVKGSQRVLDIDYRFTGVSEVTLYAEDIVSYNPSVLQGIVWKSYAGTLTVTTKWYWYNDVTNKYELQTHTSTRTLTNTTWTGVNLFDGVNLASGNGSIVIIESVVASFKPTSTGVTCGIYGIPFKGSQGLGLALNSNAGDVIYDSGVPSDAYDLFGWLVEPIEGFFALEIMPGISLGGIAFVFLAIALVLILLKIFAGG